MASQADSLALLDSLAYVYAINVVAKSASGADDMNDKIKGKAAWRDGVQVFKDVENTLFLGTSDLGSVLDDALVISCVQYIIPLSTVGYESGQWFMLDSVSVKVVVGREFGESFNFLDYLSTYLGAARLFADTLSLSDALLLTLALHPSAADTLSMSDLLGSDATAALIELVLTDSFELSDLGNTLLPTTAMTSYLRRYLNDVQR